MLNVLIVEDEIQNVEEIILLLHTCHDKYKVLRVLRSNKDIMEWFTDNQQPDLMFCDIELLDGTVFQTLKQDIVMCPIIFTTAYDSYYQEAFDSTGIAYLLKPVGLQKLEAALKKVSNLGIDKQDDNKLNDLLQALNKITQKYKERILVNTSGGMKLVSADEMVHVETREGVCYILHSNGNTYSTRCKISNFFQELNPEQFFMINRGEIVNVNFIDRIQPYFNDRLAITMKRYGKRRITSKAQTPLFRQWLTRG